MLHRNVSRNKGRPTRKSYAEAVAKVVRKVRNDFDLSAREMAERLGVSEGTIENADKSDRETNLSAVTLLCIAHEFGADAIQPVMALIDATAEPIEDEEEAGNPLPKVLGFGAKLAAAFSPDSEDGEDIGPNEAEELVTTGRAAQRALGKFLAALERRPRWFRKRAA